MKCKLDSFSGRYFRPFCSSAQRFYKATSKLFACELWSRSNVEVWLSGLQAGLDGLESYFLAWKLKASLSSFMFWLFDDEERYEENLLFSQQLEDFTRFNDVWSLSRWVEMNQLSTAQQKKLHELEMSVSVNNFLLEQRIIGVEFWFYSSYLRCHKFTHSVCSGILTNISVFRLGFMVLSFILKVAPKWLISLLD